MTTTTIHPTNSEAPEAPTNDLLPIIMRFLRTIRHRKQVLFTMLYCFVLFGAIYYWLAPRKYESEAKLLIVEQRLDKLNAVGDLHNVDNTMATHRELVVSPVVIEDAIRNLAPEHRIDLHGVPQKDWVKTISKQLNAKITRKTNFIDVSYKSRHPESAVAVVRAVIQSYLDFVEKNHKGTASEIIAVLTDERERSQQHLVQKQQELHDFRKRVGHLAVSSDNRVVDPLVQKAVRLNEVLLEATERRMELQTALISIEGSLARGEDINQHLMSIEETVGKQVLLSSMGLSTSDLQVLSDQQKKLLTAKQELQSLSADLGPNHPRIRDLQEQIKGYETYLATYHSSAGERFDSLNRAVPGQMVMKMFEQAARQAEQKEKQIEQAFLQAKSDAVVQSNTIVQLEMLEREVMRSEALVATLADKIANIDISQVQAPIKATVVSEPQPDNIPVSPQLRFLAVACLLGGTLCGCLIIYVQDVLDDRFTSLDELSTHLGVPLLAIIRKLSPLPGSGLATVHTHAMPYAAETEAFRTLRTALSLSGEVSDRVLVTSSEPGDGKTTVSTNLAVTFAQAGKRTLIIDADLRRPGLTTLTNLKGLPGVAEALSTEEPIATIAPTLVQPTEIDTLSVLPVGFRRPNPSELLSSERFVELLAWAESQFDRVIVDCPPVLACSDAQIVGHLVDGAVVVIRPEKNHRRAVIRALETFQSTGCRVFGVVANSITNDTGSYGYGYGYGQSYDYGDGEAYRDEDMEPTHTAEPPVMQAADAPAQGSVSMPSVEDPPQTIRPRRAA